MISKMGYSRRGRKLPRLACSQGQAEQALLQQSQQAPWLLRRAHGSRANPSVRARQVSGCWSSWIAVGAEADAKASLKAEMDAPDWQRWAAGAAGKGRGVQDWGSSWHTWSPWDVTPVPRQGIIGQWPAHHHRSGSPTLSSIWGSSQRPPARQEVHWTGGQHTSAPGCWLSCGSALFTAQEPQFCCLLLPQSPGIQAYDTWVHCKWSTPPPGRAPWWPGSSHCLCAKGKGEARCVSWVQSQEQGCAGREESCPQATCSWGAV